MGTAAIQLAKKMGLAVIATASSDEKLERVKALRPHTARRWGRMTAHQMVCHLVDCNRVALGEVVVTAPPGWGARR